MKYDFTSVIDRRGCGSSKWNGAKNASPEFVPLSVADMEFLAAPQIIDAIKNTAETAVLGYTSATDEFYDAVISWMKRKHDFDVKKEWIVNTPGVVNALGLLIEASTKPADSVVILAPVYYPFDMAILAKGRKIVYSELIAQNGTYEIDFDDLEKKCEMSEIKALIFSNPHNPVGKVWSEDELRKVADICCKNGVFIIDDEIHHDIIMPGYKHTVTANLGDDVLNNIAVCTAPSKTFNLAGLQCSNIIIPNDNMRAKVNACARFALLPTLNIFAYTACTAAYNLCEDWLEEFIGVISENAKLVEDFMAKHFPEIYVYPLEGTYLQWLDMKNLGMTHVELREMLEEAGLYLDYGEMFGPAGRGFQRINLACAKVTLEKALERFKNAVENTRKNRAETGKPYHKTLAVGDKIEELNISRKTLLVFSRHYSCKLCQKLLDDFSHVYNDFKAAGCDIKFIMQSSAEAIAEIQKNYSFELIADPDALLFDKYNVFEADSAMRTVTGDKLFEEAVGTDIHNLLSTEYVSGLSAVLGGAQENPEGIRKNQLCAFIAVDSESNVIYSYYSKTIGDLPETDEILNKIK